MRLHRVIVIACVANPVIPSIASLNESSLFLRTGEPCRELPCVLEDLHSKAGGRMPCNVTMQQPCSGIVCFEGNHKIAILRKQSNIPTRWVSFVEFDVLKAGVGFR